MAQQMILCRSLQMLRTSQVDFFSVKGFYFGRDFLIQIEGLRIQGVQIVKPFE